MTGSEKSFLLSQAGAEWVLRKVERDDAWRKNWTSGQAQTVTPAGGGSFTVTLTDTDGNFSDNDTEGITISAVGESSTGATYSVNLDAGPAVHPSLAFAVAAGSDIRFFDNATVEGPIHAGDDITSDNNNVTTQDDGRYEAASGGSIDGDLTPATYTSALATLSPDLAFYTAKATNLNPYDAGSTFKLYYENLTPTFSSQGTVNPEGIYQIDARTHLDVEIRDVHIKGTLIVLTTNDDVRITNSGWFESASTGYPVLLIDAGTGDFDVGLQASLQESATNRDFNEDGDRTDTFASSISGLVWSDSAYARFFGSAWTFTGCLISDTVYLDDGVILREDPNLPYRLIPGFTDGDLHVVRGTIR